MGARNPEFTGLVFVDEKRNSQEGWIMTTLPGVEYNGSLITQLQLKNGLLHRAPAIIYPDDYSEEWDNGKFVKSDE